MKKFQIITLFPEVFREILSSSMMWKATERGLASFDFVNLRDFGLGAHKSVDDTPYGGGDGMLLRVDVLARAIKFAKSQPEFSNAKVILLTPSKTIWTQKLAQDFANSSDNYILICGHYEGFDARIENFIDEKISVGEFVLTGGEIPAMILVDSIVRLIPGVLGGEKSAEIESYSDGSNLEFPQFTRPEFFRGREFSDVVIQSARDQTVPEVLLSGNHAAIAKWRDEHSQK